MSLYFFQLRLFFSEFASSYHTILTFLRIVSLYLTFQTFSQNCGYISQFGLFSQKLKFISYNSHKSFFSQNCYTVKNQSLRVWELKNLLNSFKFSPLLIFYSVVYILNFRLFFSELQVYILQFSLFSQNLWLFISHNFYIFLRIASLYFIISYFFSELWGYLPVWTFFLRICKFIFHNFNFFLKIESLCLTICTFSSDLF